MIIKCIVILSISIAGGINCARLPKDWKKCKQGNDMDTCLKSVIQEVIVMHLSNGNSKFGINPLDPLEFRKLSISHGSGPININITYNNLIVTGFKKLEIDKVATDWNKNTLNIYAHIGKDGLLHANSDYEAKGRILVLPISGFGKCKIKFENLMLNMSITWRPVVKEGQKYMKVTNFGVDLEPSKIWGQFDNVFNGDKTMSDNINRVINENWAEVNKELKPALSKSLSVAFTQISNQIFDKVPMSDIFIK